MILGKIDFEIVICFWIILFYKKIDSNKKCEIIFIQFKR